MRHHAAWRCEAQSCSRLQGRQNPADHILEAGSDRDQEENGEEINRALEALGLLEGLGDGLELAFDERHVRHNSLHLSLEANKAFPGGIMLTHLFLLSVFVPRCESGDRLCPGWSGPR